jgi:anti-sigma B factor antagonist
MKLPTEELVDGTAALVTISLSHLDASNTGSFRDTLKPVLDGHDTVVLDLGPVEFIDSSGLGALLSCLRTMNSKQGELKLFGMSKPVQAMFELVRMHRLFAIYNTREEAVASL